MRVLRGVYRVRLIVIAVGLVICLVNAVRNIAGLPQPLPVVWPVVVYGAVAGIGAMLLLSLLGGKLHPRHERRTLQAPVRGRWLALNTPSSAVPSHGVRIFGQAYAIDLAARPAEGPEPPYDRGGMVPPEAFAAFGAPIHAMAAGTVVRTCGWQRDHRSRTSGWAHLWLFVEGNVRQLGGPLWVLGNHVVIRHDDGAYAAYAHLRRGSLRVRRGEQVEAGQLLGECGNSGNTTEPHLHAQLMDRASLLTAAGIPFEFAAVEIGPRDDPIWESYAHRDSGMNLAGVPHSGEYLLVPEDAGSPR